MAAMTIPATASTLSLVKYWVGQSSCDPGEAFCTVPTAPSVDMRKRLLQAAPGMQAKYQLAHGVGSHSTTGLLASIVG